MSCPFCDQPLANVAFRKADGHYKEIKRAGYCIGCKMFFTIHKTDIQDLGGSKT